MTVQPKDAATVILCREIPGQENNGFTVLMAKRDVAMSFVPGAYVFPGGRVDASDCDPQYLNYVSGITPEKAYSILDKIAGPQQAFGVWIAALRETFEETGVLLTRHNGCGGGNFGKEIGTRIRNYRELLLDKNITFLEILKEEKIQLDAGRLLYYSHWITPELSPIRYDVRFFMAKVSHDQQSSIDGRELTEQVWIEPGKALCEFGRGGFSMVLPTYITMEELSRFKKIADIVDYTSKKNIEGILTRAKNVSGRLMEYMPDGRIVENLQPFLKDDQ